MHVISGRVVLKESRKGIAGLVVSALAITSRSGSTQRSQRLGSDVTNADGQFTINYEIGSEDSDLTINVTAPHGSGSDPGEEVLAQVSRRDMAKREILNIVVPRAKLQSVGMQREEKNAADIIARRRAAGELRAELNAERRRALAAKFAEGKRIRGVAAESFQKFLSAVSGLDREHVGRRFLQQDSDLDKEQERSVKDGIATLNQMKRLSYTAFTDTEIADLRNKFGRDLLNIPSQAIAALRPELLSRYRRSKPAHWWCRNQEPVADCVKFLDPPLEDTQPAGDTVTEDPAHPAPEPESPSDVTSLLGRLLKSIESPEGQVRLDRPGQEDVQGNVDGLQLRSGPADVPALYDFHRLEIAFEPIWKELFDQRTVEIGTRLYEKLVELGLDPNEYLLGSGELPVRMFPKFGNNDDSMVEAPPSVMRHFEITQQEWNSLDQTHRDELENRLVVEIEAAYEEQKNIEQFAKTLTEILGGAAAAHLRAMYNEMADRKIRALRAQGARIIKYAKAKLQAPNDWDDYHELLDELRKRLREPYRFNIYAAGRRGRSVNFGIVSTYRQRWTPTAYQVGELVRTVPLAPKEVRRYSRRLVRKLTRAERDSHSTLDSMRSESKTTVRAESEIIAKARSRGNYAFDAKAGLNLGVVSIEGATKLSEETEQESHDTKREFREAVFSAAQEWREEHKLEVETSESSELLDEETGEISNPNDELTVTYLFYELQRRYRLDEKLHRVQPVILVAQEFSDNIDEDWVVAHDWILRQHLLHPSFMPALDYLATRVVGDEHALTEQYNTLQQQRRILETITSELTILRTQVASRYQALQRSIGSRADAIQADNQEGFLEVGHEFLFGDADADPEALKVREDAARDAYERLARQEQDLSARLSSETSAVAQATASYTSDLSEHLNRRAQIARLLVHIRQNLFHYMQAIYSHEPPDQRYFRLRDVKVPRLVGETTYSIETDKDSVPLPPTWTKPHKLVSHVKLNPEKLKYDSLGDVADLNNLLGFAGNMMIFPMKQDNALTSFMTAPYYDPFTGLQDPDVLGTWTLKEFAEHVCCLKRYSSEAEFAKYLPGLTETYRRLKERDSADDEIIVPTGSIYIEALPGTHPLLEDFKLAHRGLDVKRAQAITRAAELENLRMAARLLAGEREDPNIDKKIVIEGNADVSIDES